MLHSKKKESILAWIQSTGGTHIKSLKQLADGIIFYRLIQTLSDKNHEQNNSTNGSISDDKVGCDSDTRLSENVVKEKNELDKVIKVQKEDVCESESVMTYSTKSNLEQDSVIEDCYSDSVKSKTEDVDVTNCDKSSSVSATDVNDISQNSLNELNVNNELISEKNESFTKNISAMEISLDENNSNFPCEDNHLINNGDLNGDLNLCHAEDSGAYSLVDTSSSDDINMKQKTVELEGRYDVVKRFIENMLELRSEDLVCYDSCVKGIEFELAKVTVLILSALVQYSISSKADHITATCCGLSFESQEEIKDCLELFLSERTSAVEKKEFHAKLARTAKPRISPRKSFTPTPLHNTVRQTRRRNLRKQLENKVTFVEEEFESPIQNLLKSPHIRKMTPNSEARLLDAMRCKDKTIALLTYDLDEEKCNVSDLKKQNEELNFQLQKLKKEMEKLKIELTETCDLLTKQELNFESIKKELENQLKNSRNQIEDLEKDIAFLREESQLVIEKENVDIFSNPVIPEKSEKFPCCDVKGELESLECTVQAKEDKIKELFSENESLQVHIAKLEFDNEELKNKLELQDHLNTDPQFIPPVEEKCFNIVDLTVRNDLRDKCDELQQCLEDQKTEYENKIKKLKEQLANKDSKEKDWKAMFRKADKDREEAVKWRKKLEEENIKLKAENELYVKICPKVPSSSQPTLSSDGQLITAKSLSEPEKIGFLWTLCDEKTPASTELSVDTNLSPISQRVHQKTKSQLDLSGSQIDSYSKRGLKRRYNSLSPKAVPNQSNKSDSILMEMSPAVANGKLSCTEKEFYTIKTLVKSITNIFLQKNNQKEALTELQMFSKNFYSVKDLINVLTLFLTIITHELSIQSHSTPNSNQSNFLEVEKDKHLQKLIAEIVNLKKEIKKLKQTSVKEPLAKEVIKPENQNITKRMTESALCIKKLEEKNKESEKHFLQLENTIKVYKNKVMSLELKLKEFKNMKLMLEKNYKYLESVKNAIEEKYEISCKENVEMKKKLIVFEEKCSINTSSTSVCLPNANCEQCSLLFEKIESCESESKSLQISLEFLKEDLKSLKNENCVLVRKIRSLMQEKKVVEQQLIEEKKMYTTKIDPSFYSVNGRLTDISTIKKENNEKNNVKTSKGMHNYCGFDNKDSNSIKSLKNVTTGLPSNKMKDHQAVANHGNSRLSAFCKAEDEAEMLSQSSLAEVRNESPNERLKEFQRRNSLYLPHLKSVYAMELNTTPTQTKYFMAPTQVSKNPTSKKHPSNDSHQSVMVKRRKISNASQESALHLSPPRSINPKRVITGKRIHPQYLPSSTPKEKTSFTQRMCQTPSSFIRIRSMLKSQKSKLK